MAELIDWKLEPLDKKSKTIEISFNSIEMFLNPMGFTHVNVS